MAVAPGVLLFSDRSIPKSEKCVIYLFTGKALRPMMPTVSLLQHIPSSRFDIVVLHDARHLCFEGGIPGMGDTMPSLLTNLSTRLGHDEYLRSLTFGVSSGGFAALRAGIFLSAERAIAIGGRMSWHVGRLLKKQGTIPAFDPLCNCGPRNGTRLIAAYAAEHPADALDAGRLARVLPVERWPLEGTDRHSILYQLYEENRLRPYLLRLLDG